MKPFATSVPMRGWRAWGAIVMCVLVFAVVAAVFAVAGFGWVSYLFGAWMGGISLFILVMTIGAMRRQHTWVLKADEQHIEWYETDRTGRIREKQDVPVSEIVEIEDVRSGESANGIYLKTRAGELLRLSNHLASGREFLEWIKAHFTEIPVVEK